MKKLGKKIHEMVETVEAYATQCGCTCSCSCAGATSMKTSRDTNNTYGLSANTIYYGGR